MTAIQQMIDFINNINDNDRSEFNYYYDHIMEKLNELLEVEKQQMSSQTISDESWEGCDGCTEQDKYFWTKGYQAGYNRATPTEISDEEMYKESFKKGSFDWHEGFMDGAKWYRDQLKQRQ